MPVPLRNSRLEALNVAIAKGEAVFSVWTKWSPMHQMFYVGASACFEGELYDLTDVGWVLRGEQKRALCLSPVRPEIEGDQPPEYQAGITEGQGRPSAIPDKALEHLAENIPLIAAAFDAADAAKARDEADEREQTFVEELGSAVEIKLDSGAEIIPDSGEVRGDAVEPAAVVAQVETPPEDKLADVPPEEQPIVRTPGKAKQAVKA